MGTEKPENGASQPDEAFQEQTESLKLAASELRNLDGSKSAVVNKTHNMNVWLRYSTVGIQFTVTMVALTAAGYGLDYWLGTLPWLTVAGAVFGTVAAMTSVIRQVLRMEDQTKAKSK